MGGSLERPVDPRLWAPWNGLPCGSPSNAISLQSRGLERSLRQHREQEDVNAASHLRERQAHQTSETQVVGVTQRPVHGLSLLGPHWTSEAFGAPPELRIIVRGSAE